MELFRLTVETLPTLQKRTGKPEHELWELFLKVSNGRKSAIIIILENGDIL